MDESNVSRQPKASSDERGFLPWTLAALVGVIVLLMGWVVLAPRGLAVNLLVVRPSSAAGVTVYGFVSAPVRATISSRVPGRLQQFVVPEGAEVRQGQTIAILESGDAKSDLDAARQAVSKAELEAAQAKNAVAEGQRQGISAVDLQKLQAERGLKESQVEQARAREQQAGAKLGRALVRAPFAGTLLRQRVGVGDFVTPATPIAAFADLTTLDAEVEASQAMIGRIHEGDEARITVDAYPRTFFRGRVRKVAPMADRPDGGITIEVAFIDRDKRILPGMTANVAFGDAIPGVLVPKAALIEDDQGSYVWLVESGRAHAHTVEPGPEHGNRLEIRSGLSGGETVITDPSASLREGMRVRPRS